MHLASFWLTLSLDFFPEKAPVSFFHSFLRHHIFLIVSSWFYVHVCNVYIQIYAWHPSLLIAQGPFSLSFTFGDGLQAKVSGDAIRRK